MFMSLRYKNYICKKKITLKASRTCYLFFVLFIDFADIYDEKI